MSFVFNVSVPVVNVGIILLQGFIGCCWIVVIYRVVSLGSELDIIPLPSSFPHYPSLSSPSATKQSWISLGCGIVFFISFLEVSFSIYYWYLIRRVQVESLQGSRSFEHMKGLYFRALSSGLEPNSSSSLQRDIVKSVGSDASAVIPPSTHNFPLEPLPFDHPKAKDFRESQTVWFRNCRWEEIYRENHQEWLCVFLFNKTLEQVKQEDKLKTKEEEALETSLEEILIAYERRAGTKIQEGYNELLREKVMRLPKDPVKVSMRPLTLYYGSAWTTSELVRQIMKWNGFLPKQCFNRKNGLKYLLRIPPSWTKLPLQDRPPPIIFIHGIGSGLFLYIALIKFLTFSEWSKERPVMVIIQPHISMQAYSRAFLHPPNQAQVENDMKEVFHDLGFNHTGIELLAHSNGTVVAGWIIKALPKLIRRCCFMDPVCFALWEGYVCYNFLYSEPKTGLEKLLRFGLSEELGIAWYTRRHFHWPDAVLWPEQIPGFRDSKRFMVVLAGKDAIINASRVRDYLVEAGMDDNFPSSPPSGCEAGLHSRTKSLVGGILFDPDSAHGQACTFGHPFLEKVFQWLQNDGYPHGERRW